MTLITEQLNAGKKLVGDSKKLLQRCLKKNKLRDFCWRSVEDWAWAKKEEWIEEEKKRKDIVDSRNWSI